MKVIEPVDEEAMVMAWVEAERVAPLRRAAIEQVVPPDAELTPELARGALAFTRGYSDRLIFRGLPVAEMDWSRVSVTVEQLGDFSHLNYPTFQTITEGSLRVGDGATNIDGVQAGENLNQRVRAVEAALRDGLKPPPLIAVAVDASSRPVLIEGNTRATAYLLCSDPADAIEVILGTSPDLYANWAFA